ncbi:hypothetical protein ACQP0C_41545 (plasmid) [Nocardia sp. CA-129566]|uniref:hypothetical protein n=1 Tax=Nocardia sp. CA-129566 TaxID=3239976 RepID=UPI003D9889A8
MSNELDRIHSVTTRLRGYDLVLLDQAIAQWKLTVGSRKIDTSVALNAAALLIIRAGDENLIREHAERKGMPDQDLEKLIGYYKWFFDEYFEVLRDVVETRKRLDGRRKGDSGEE